MAAVVFVVVENVIVKFVGEPPCKTFVVCFNDCNRFLFFVMEFKRFFVSGRLRSTVPAGVQGMASVSWFDLCAAFSVRPWSLPSGRPRSDGPSRP